MNNVSNTACRQRSKSCFAYSNGACCCLQDTNFGGRACPFYKDYEAYKIQLKRYPYIPKSSNKKYE